MVPNSIRMRWKPISIAVRMKVCDRIGLWSRLRMPNIPIRIPLSWHLQNRTTPSWIKWPCSISSHPRRLLQAKKKSCGNRAGQALTHSKIVWKAIMSQSFLLKNIGTELHRLLHWPSKQSQKTALESQCSKPVKRITFIPCRPLKSKSSKGKKIFWSMRKPPILCDMLRWIPNWNN